MLALAAAGSVFEIGGTVHRLNVFALSFLGRFLSLLWFLSGCALLAGNSLCSGSDGPDEARQFTGNYRDDLPLVFAGSTQFHIALVQAVLRFPSNLFDLFRKCSPAFCAIHISNSWVTTIAPGCLDNDSSQVRRSLHTDCSRHPRIAPEQFRYLSKLCRVDEESEKDRQTASTFSRGYDKSAGGASLPNP